MRSTSATELNITISASCVRYIMVQCGTSAQRHSAMSASGAAARRQAGPTSAACGAPIQADGATLPTRLPAGCAQAGTHSKHSKRAHTHTQVHTPAGRGSCQTPAAPGGGLYGTAAAQKQYIVGISTVPARRSRAPPPQPADRRSDTTRPPPALPQQPRRGGREDGRGGKRGSPGGKKVSSLSPDLCRMRVWKSMAASSKNCGGGKREKKAGTGRRAVRTEAREEAGQGEGREGGRERRQGWEGGSGQAAGSGSNAHQIRRTPAAHTHPCVAAARHELVV